jgi:hypothetical protein
MQRKFTSLGIALAAVLAFGALASANASAAQPQFFRGGAPLAETVTFTGTSGAGTLQTGTTKVTCSSDTSSGSTKGSTEVTGVVVTFKGCVSSGFPCTSSGQASGTIVTNKLKGKLVGIFTETGVGLLLEPETAGGLFAEFSCAGFISAKVKGSVIGIVEPVGKEQTTGTLKFTPETAGSVQKPSSYKCGATSGSAQLETSVSGGAFKASTEETTESVTFAKAVEVTPCTG